MSASPEAGAVGEEPVERFPAQGGHSSQLHLLQVLQGVLAKHLGGGVAGSGKPSRIVCYGYYFCFLPTMGIDELQEKWVDLTNQLTYMFENWDRGELTDAV